MTGFVPLLQIPMSLDEGLDGDDVILLQTFLGLAMAVGSFLFGLVASSKSKQCMISKQYLLQAANFGIGKATTLPLIINCFAMTRRLDSLILYLRTFS